ncbi:hypothetical protein IQ247_09375 [Plectonema cf. radiosum LEGE 06105]|uniref:Glyoxalase-like domain-containing protein n=1 Tax=Plectonema cf. radiosum LEGE 06105 TaxID=945769 RepID=A0A8J7F3Y0_9CYAN|nr:hypothetical protein [Plectonema radiosum]MBE9212900.1 hypothetical protein [Plectonema cf. radiosum LEGE 06105]
MAQLLINETLLEIDHIFVCLGAAPNKLSLEKIGLICGEKISYHPQQGTASSLICFENTYIELIWVEDEIKAEIYAMRSGIDFIARSYSPTKITSPFGIALHQKPNIVHREYNNLSNKLINQSSQSPEQFINFAAANLAVETEPLCFMIPEQVSFLTIFNPLLEDHQKLINHPLGIKKLTNTRIFMRKVGNLTNPISMLKTEGIIEIEQNSLPLLELTFDYGSRMTSVDLQSIGIPIVLKY